MKKLIRIILALAIGSTLIGCSSKPGGTIDLTSHIKVSIKGFNGKGEVISIIIQSTIKRIQILETL